MKIRILDIYRGQAGRAKLIQGYSFVDVNITWDAWLHYSPDGFCIPPNEIIHRVHEDDLSVLLQSVSRNWVKEVLPKILKNTEKA